MSGHDDESTAAGRIINRGKNDRMLDGPIARENRREFTPERQSQRLDALNIERSTLSKKMANQARRGFYGRQRAVLSKHRHLMVKADKQSYQMDFQIRDSKKKCAGCINAGITAMETQKSAYIKRLTVACREHYIQTCTTLS